MCLSTPSKCLQLKKEDLNKKCSQNIHSAMAKKLNAFIQVYFQCQYGTYRLQSLRVYWDTNAQNTHRIIFEDILKATGKLGRQPHKGHLPS